MPCLSLHGARVAWSSEDLASDPLLDLRAYGPGPVGALDLPVVCDDHRTGAFRSAANLLWSQGNVDDDIATRLVATVVAGDRDGDGLLDVEQVVDADLYAPWLALAG